MKEKAEKFKKQFLNNLSASRIPVVSHPKIINAADHVLTLSFVRYLIIGFASFGMDFGIFYVLDKYSPIKGIAANLTSTLVTWVFNYLMMNFWTFKAGKNAQRKKMGRYFILATFNYIFNNVIFQIMTVNLGVNSLITKVIITGLIVCWNFFLYKLWVFKTDIELQAN